MLGLTIEAVEILSPLVGKRRGGNLSPMVEESSEQKDFVVPDDSDIEAILVFKDDSELKEILVFEDDNEDLTFIEAMDDDQEVSHNILGESYDTN